ncbi:MAG: hypothetical protein J6S04_05795 [Clostridia bacterium]|nr:hypothetical protein [Clostridia bacterium]
MKKVEKNKKSVKNYKKLHLEIHYLEAEDVLTESEEMVFPGDGWVKDPFTQE